MSTLADAVKLKDDILPTVLDIYQHYLYLNSIRGPGGDWKQNTSISEKVQCVLSDVAALWNRTAIPHDLAGRLGEKRIMNLVNKCRSMNKVAMERRGEDFGQDLNILFDVAICKHPNISSCTCNNQEMVPLTWRAFLLGVLSERSSTLRTAKNREREEHEAKEVVRYKVEELEREEHKEDEKRKKSQEDINNLLDRVPIQPEHIEQEFSESDDVIDPSDDSDWEDMDDTEEKETKHYNTMSLQYFARECDRYGVMEVTRLGMGF